MWSWYPISLFPEYKSDSEVCYVAQLIYTHMSSSNSPAAFDLAWSSAFPLLVSAFFRRPKVEHFLSLAHVPKAQAHRMVECTSVTQLHRVGIMFLHVITHLDYKLPESRALWFSSIIPIVQCGGRS